MHRAWIGFLVLAGMAAAQPRLEVDQPAHGHIQDGRVDSYGVDAKAGDYFEVVGEPADIDIFLRLIGPDGKLLQVVNHLGFAGAEQLIQIADQDGVYGVEVHPARDGRTGDYVIRLAARRPAEAADREGAAADAKFRQILGANSKDDANAMQDLAGTFARLGMVRRQALAWGAAGDLNAQKFSWTLAETAYGKALELWRGVKDRPGEGRILLSRARLYYALSNYTKCLDDTEHAAAIAREIHSAPMEASALEISAAVYTRSGKPLDAVSNLEKTLAIRRAEGDRPGEASALSNLGYAHFALSHHDTAVAQ